jgi:hypothetical protein
VGESCFRIYPPGKIVLSSEPFRTHNLNRKTFFLLGSTLPSSVAFLSFLPIFSFQGATPPIAANLCHAAGGGYPVMRSSLAADRLNCSPPAQSFPASR